MTPDTLYQVSCCQTQKSRTQRSINSQAAAGILQIAGTVTRRAKRDLIDTTNTQPQTKKHKSGLLTQSDEEEDGIAKATKKFTIVHLFWLHQDRQMFWSKPNKQYDDLQCFENDNNKIQGQLVDLLEFLPSTFMDMIWGGNVAWLSKKIWSVHLY